MAGVLDNSFPRTCPPLARLMRGGSMWRNEQSRRLSLGFCVFCFLVAGGFGLCFAPQTASGATYYVDALNPAANDLVNPGSEALPWKTLTKANTVLVSGDTCIVANGNYDPFTLSITSDRTDWITYRAATGHQPNIKSGLVLASELVVSLRINSPLGVVKNAYLCFDGFKFSAMIYMDGKTDYVKFLNCDITQGAAIDSNNVEISGYWAPYFVGSRAAVMCNGLVNNFTVQDCNVHDAYVCLRINGSDVTVHGNLIHKFGADGITIAPSADLNNITIEDNQIYDLRLCSGGVTIFGTKDGNFAPYEPIRLVGPSPLATAICSGTPWSSSSLHGWDNSSKTMFDYQIEWSGKIDPSYYILGDWSGATLTNLTYMAATGADGIDMETSAGINNLIIRRNIIDLRTEYRSDNATGQTWKLGCDTPSKPNANLVIENNIINAGDRLRRFAASQTSMWGMSNAKINNNVFIGDNGGVTISDRYNTNCTIAEFYNNVVETLTVYNNLAYSGTVTITAHGNNIFKQAPVVDAPFVFVVNETERVLTTGRNLEALFVDFDTDGNGVSDFRLAANSLAINFGNANYGPATDILGKSRVGAPDAGCYEYIPPSSNNHAPVPQSIGSKSVNENALLTFTVTATDPDGDTVTYSYLGLLPAGATFSSPFRWTPGYDQAGTYNVTFVARDEHGAQSSQTVTITVNNVNRPPVLAAIGNKSVDENALLTFTISATDPDGGTITYSALNRPTGSTFSGPTFKWTPGYNQAGSYQVTFIASDGKSQDSEIVTITVNNVNRAPVLAAISNKSVNENSALSFSVSATDPDGDTVTYSASGLPTGATFSGQTFSWTPGYDKAGTYNVDFIARDGYGAQSSPRTVTITVNNVNRPPVLSSIGNKSVYQNELLNFTVIATDPDGSVVTYSASGLPAGATFVGSTFNWQPSSTQVGNYQVTFVARDGALQDSETITVTVLRADKAAPVVTNCLPAAGAIQVPLNTLITLHVTDAGKGVNAASVTIKVDDDIVYSGDTPAYNSSRGTCRRTGTPADYAFVYQANEMFDFDQPVTVLVNAADIAGNVMSQYSYSFKTEMWSFGQNKRVSLGSDTISKGAPATARDSASNIWAVWHLGAAGSRDIYVSKLSAGDNDFGKGLQLTNNSADQCNPAIAVGSDDKLYVVWQDNRRGNWDIYASVSANGITWSTGTLVTDSNDNQINPAIAIDNLSPNRAHVVWQDDRNGNQDIFIATPSNSFLTETVSQITFNVADQTEPAIAVDSSNKVYVVWTDGRNGSSDIYAGSSSSGPWTNVPFVNSAGNQSSPAIAAESSGTILHLLWVDDRSGNQDIYYVSSNGLPGSPVNGSSIIDDTSGANQLSPVIITNGGTGNDLKVFACWQDRRNVIAGSSDTDIYFTEITSSSRTNVLVGDDDTNSDQDEPAMGIDMYGHPYLVWADARSANTEIYYAGSTFVEPVALAAKEVPALSGVVVGTDPAAITSVDDVSVVVPSGVYPCDVRITISKVKNPQAFATPCLGSYDFGPSGMQFSQPVTVTIPYPAPSSGSSALAYWYNSLTGALSQQGITDVENIQISYTLYALRFKTTHFTPFYLLGGSTEGGGGGGGGGCSISPSGECSIIEFFLPYIGLAIVMAIVKLRDKRNQKVNNIPESKR